MNTIDVLWKKVVGCLCLAILTALIASAASAQQSSDAAPGSLIQGLRDGKIDLNLRARYEHVDDDAAADDADALTLRTLLGYTSGTINNFSFRLSAQDVRKIINNYNDATGRPTAKTNYAVVADPADTDLLEAYLAFRGLPETTIKAGRQIITYRPGAGHRFIGTVLWRQNWQNHDAITLENRSLNNTIIRYAYSWNVNRIFTEKGVGARANYDSNSHFFNLQYTGLGSATLEAYAYLLDFDNAAALSTATYGARLNGSFAASEQLSLLYTAEFAMQDDRANNPASIGEDYFIGELGATFKPGNTVSTVTGKISYEVLEGNGTTSFKTPLATGHAYQGWADRFLSTPADGVEDLYVTLNAVIAGINFTAVYHDFSSNHDSYDYGTEIDLQATKALNKNFTVGLKYSDYDADSNPTNVARNGAIAMDVQKFWAWVQFSY